MDLRKERWIYFMHLILYSTIGGDKESSYRLLVGKPEGETSLGRPRRRWVDSIKMELGEIGWNGRDWIELAQDRDQWRALVNTVMNLRVL
jgi:hypothetical protein